MSDVTLFAGILVTLFILWLRTCYLRHIFVCREGVLYHGQWRANDLAWDALPQSNDPGQVQDTFGVTWHFTLEEQARLYLGLPVTRSTFVCYRIAVRQWLRSQTQ